ncbi:hypothetical protein H8E77_22480 [bacterium]|nr:hypothetical protein [bacterium]
MLIPALQENGFLPPGLYLAEMIQNFNELEVCKHRLTKLQNRIEQIVIHPKKSRRAKEMELAGVRGMIEQLQREIQSYELAQIQQSIP